MWARLDDALIDHAKIFTAGAHLGTNGAAIAIGMFAVGLIWSNRHLSDGFLPAAVVKRFPHVERPLKVADALVKAGLWETTEGGFRVHDFHEWNLGHADARAKRDHVADVRSKAGTNGARVRWQKR
jgi:hypothetical protein